MHAKPDVSLHGRKTILLVCYKIQQGKGSEDASGYEIARRLGEQYNVVLISRRNNIDRLRSDPAFADFTLIPIDVPRALSFYKRGGRGIMPYYYLWQICVGIRARRLLSEFDFSIVHHMNFHTDLAPHFLSPPPRGKLVWGPIAHHKTVPFSFYPKLSGRAVLNEWGRAVLKGLFWRFDPFLRRAIRRAAVILYADDDVARPYKRVNSRVSLQAYAGADPMFERQPRRRTDFNVLTVGRLIPLKGFLATIDAFEAFLHASASRDDIHLTIVGSGPMLSEMEYRIRQLGICDHVTIVDWLPQAELAQYYADASVFLYPSWEAQGLVVSEAMAAAVPVICLQRTGPGFLVGDAGITVPVGGRTEVVRHLVCALQEVHNDYLCDSETNRYTTRSAISRHAYDERLNWDAITAGIANFYEE